MKLTLYGAVQTYKTSTVAPGARQDRLHCYAVVPQSAEQASNDQACVLLS